jgi:hypothetical protein
VLFKEVPLMWSSLDPGTEILIGDYRLKVEAKENPDQRLGE